MFSFFLVPFKILQKMWTGGQVVKILRKQFQHYWFNHLKVWTVDKKMAFYFMFSFCPSTFRQNLFESVDMRTKKCLSISYFLSVMQPSQFWQKSVDSVDRMKILKKVSISFILLLENVDLWKSSCLSILFLLNILYPSEFWQKSVDRWSSNENFWKKNQF